jgi:hypothetical protein
MWGYGERRTPRIYRLFRQKYPNVTERSGEFALKMCEAILLALAAGSVAAGDTMFPLASVMRVRSGSVSQSSPRQNQWKGRRSSWFGLLDNPPPALPAQQAGVRFSRHLSVDTLLLFMCSVSQLQMSPSSSEQAPSLRDTPANKKPPACDRRFISNA